jgi:predicted RNase H-like nuclease (RuvC/YqgF family)
MRIKSPPKTTKPPLNPAGQRPRPDGPYITIKGKLHKQKKLTQKQVQKIKLKEKIEYLKNEIEHTINKLAFLRRPWFFGKEKYNRKVYLYEKTISDLEYDLLLLENPDIKKEMDNLLKEGETR